ncbi:MAG: hypothetical protein ABWX84_14595 [Nocardioides sp.]
MASSFLTEPEPRTPEAQAMFDAEAEELGYVMNLSRMWAHHPRLHNGLFDLVAESFEAAGLSFKDRGILIAAAASTLGDPYCSLAWGTKLAGESDGEVAASVLRGEDQGLDERERALARWARAVVRDPNGTTPAHVEALRAVGYDDGQVQAITTFVALRLAFSTVNDALGAVPDDELRAAADPQVRAAVTWGR